MTNHILIKCLFIAFVLFSSCSEILQEDLKTDTLASLPERVSVEKPKWSRSTYKARMTDVVYISSTLLSDKADGSRASLELNYNCYADVLSVNLHWPNRTMVHYNGSSTSAYLMMKFDDGDSRNMNVSASDDGTFFNIGKFSPSVDWIEDGLKNKSKFMVQAIHLNQSDLQTREFKLAEINGEVSYLSNSCPPDHEKIKRAVQKVRR